jgi:hypothetical protein
MDLRAKALSTCETPYGGLELQLVSCIYCRDTCTIANPT